MPLNFIQIPRLLAKTIFSLSLLVSMFAKRFHLFCVFIFPLVDNSIFHLRKLEQKTFGVTQTANGKKTVAKHFRIGEADKRK
jgi:hypothetical protein